MKEGKLQKQRKLKKYQKKQLSKTETKIIKDKTREEKSLIGTNRGQ